MSDETELKTIIEDIGKAHKAFREAHEKEMAEIKARGAADAVTVENVAKIQDALDKLSAEKGAQEKLMLDLEKKVARQSASPGDETKSAIELKAFNRHVEAWDPIRRRTPHGGIEADALAAYKSAMPSYLRGGPGPDEVKAMSVGGDPDGGYLVTPDTSGKIVTRVFDTSEIRQIASVQVIGTDELEGLRDTDEASAGWVGETAARPSTANPQLGKWAIRAHEMYAMPEATQKLLDDANVDVESWLGEKVSDKFARLENTAFVVGSGVGQPRGFASYATAATADASRAWGTLEHVVTGANGAFASTNPADVLFDLISKFKPFYLNNATWVLPRSVLALIRKFKEATTNAYMWQPGLQKGVPPTLLGYPVVMAEDMPALGTGSLSVAFGDFRISYQIVDRAGIRVLRDPFTNKPYVRFYTTKRTGGDVVQFEALKFLKFST